MKFNVTFTSTVTIEAPNDSVANGIVEDQMFDFGEATMPTVTNIEVIDGEPEPEPCDCDECLDKAKRRAGLMTRREYVTRRTRTRTRG